MNQIEMFVKLVIPDTTAITAFHTLERMGYKKLKKLQRQDYYKFYFSGDVDKFKKDISKVDILVNANKHRHSFDLGEKGVKILIKEIDDGAKGTLSILKNRLGFKNITKMEKGTLWILDADEDTAKEIAKKLFYNKHYQEMKII